MSLSAPDDRIGHRHGNLRPVEQTKTGVSQAVENRQIQNLPSHGRRVDQFALLTPGATTDGSSGGVSFRGVPGGNAFLQDGNDVTQQWGLDIAGGSVVPSSVSQDAVQEFQVQTSGYSAEFGRAVGGVINTVTKSGTNETFTAALSGFSATAPLTRRTAMPTPIRRSGHDNRRQHRRPNQKGQALLLPQRRIHRPQLPARQLHRQLAVLLAFRPVHRPVRRPATPAQCSAAQAYFQRFFQPVSRTVDQDLGLGNLTGPGEKHSLSASFNLLNFVCPPTARFRRSRQPISGVGANGIQSPRPAPPASRTLIS